MESSSNASISACLIIKNEEKTIENCLNSIKDLVDEIIIVDTGSTDNSKEIAKKFTTKIFDFKWIDDFSRARNFSLSKATKNWILVLDADETISKKDHEKIKNLINKDNSHAFYFNLRDYTENNKISGWTSSIGDKYEESKFSSGFYTRKILRFFKNKKEFYYEGRIHETPDNSINKTQGTVLNTNIILHHFGNLDKEKYLSKKQVYLNMLKQRLEKREFTEKPEDNICFEIARELYNLKQIKQAILFLEQAIKIKEKPIYLQSLGELYILEKRLDNAEQILKKGVILDSKNPKIHNSLGIIYAKKQEDNKAIRKFEKAIQLDSKFANPYFNLGLIYKKKNKIEKMNHFFNKASELNPSYNKKINFITRG